MAVMISTNAAFVNASSYLDESRSYFWKPVLPHAYYNYRRVVRLNSRKAKTKVIFCLNLNTKEVGLKTSGDGGLEFKPSFDRYLQIMESVKTARKKKKFDRLKGEDDDGGGDNGDSGVRDDVRTKSDESKDESFRRRYSRQEMVSDKVDERGFNRNEKSGIQRVSKDVKWSKSGEPEDESFKGRYLKQEHHRSSDTSLL